MDEKSENQLLVEEEVEATGKRHPRPYLGIVLATISSLFFSLCSVIVKWMEEMDPVEMAAWRFVGVLLPAIPIAIWRGENVFPRGFRRTLLLRSFVGTTGLVLSFYAFRNMALADASVIVFSVPVFVSVFAYIFLKEPCDRWSAGTVLLTIAGVILITRPTFLFGGHSVPPLGGIEGVERGSEVWGGLAALASTLFGANAYILLRLLKGLHFSVVMINFGSVALIETLALSWALGTLTIPPCGMDRYLLFALAAFSFGGQILLTVALQLEKAGPVSVARSADIVFAFFWQVLFFKEAPNTFSLIGATLVTSSVLLTALRKKLSTHSSSTPQSLVSK